MPRENDYAPIDLRDYGNVQQAADVYQWNLIKGIEKNLKRNITILNAPFVGTFPTESNRMVIPSYAWRHGKSTHNRDYSISFINIFAIRNISREIQLKKAVETWINSIDKTQQNVVIVYSMHGPFMQLIKYIKSKNPSIKICLIIPDLPEYMRDINNSGKVYQVLKNIDMLRNKQCTNFVDGFVLLTEQMATMLNIEDKKYIVIEGMVDAERFKNITPIQEAYKSIVYTGGLMKRYGMMELLDAFGMIQGNDYQLMLCGDGDAKNYILQKAQQDCRIQYLGVVSPAESLDIQMRADILINPRQPIGEYTKYSFPSKNMEYLCAGKPVVAYKSEGIPDEYDGYMHYIVGNHGAGIANAIQQIMSLTTEKRIEMGRKGQEFVKKYKNIDSQTMKIIELINGLFEKKGKHE